MKPKIHPALKQLLERADEMIGYTNRNLREINDYIDETERFLYRSRIELLKRYGIYMN